MTPHDPDYQTRVRAIFTEAAFVRELGITLVDLGPGICETTLTPDVRHTQQDGLVHAGVSATLADHTAGAAASTLCRADQRVLTSEFKIHLLRPAKGTLRCQATVLRPGSQLTVVEADVFSGDRLSAKLLATIALVGA